MELTDGTLLGGKLRYRQPAAGYRTGIEPVLLAAWVPARPGDRVLEAGTGAGAGLLCLWQRVAGVEGVGVELDADLAATAEGNAALNGAPLRFRCCDVLALAPEQRLDHMFSNPPWHRADATPSPDAARRRAKQATPGLLGAWVQALAPCLRHRGTLTLALPAACLVEGLGAMSAAGLGSVTILPLWPKAGRAAKLLLVRATRGANGADTLLAGLVLHYPDGSYTAEADAVLRDGAALAA